METQIHAKNQKKILNGQGCRTGTNAPMDESEFIGSFRSLKTTNSYKKLSRRLEDIGSKVHFLAKKVFLGTKTPLRGKFFLTQFFFTGHRSGMETSCKKSEKISNSLGCRTGTDGRTHKSEFIGSFRSLKTSGEPTSTPRDGPPQQSTYII